MSMEVPEASPILVEAYIKKKKKTFSSVFYFLWHIFTLGKHHRWHLYKPTSRFWRSATERLPYDQEVIQFLTTHTIKPFNWKARSISATLASMTSVTMQA